MELPACNSGCQTHVKWQPAFCCHNTNGVLSLCHLGQRMFFLKPGSCIKKNHTLWCETELSRRELQPDSNNSWSYVDRPLEGDLILPMIICVFGVPVYWLGILLPKRFCCLRQTKDFFDSATALKVYFHFLMFYTAIIISRYLLRIRIARKHAPYSLGFLFSAFKGRG